MEADSDHRRIAAVSMQRKISGLAGGSREDSGPTAWLLIAADPKDIEYAGNDGYHDDPSRTYAWDDTVPNHGRLAPGHLIALWDKRVLLGVSIIERIITDNATKKRHRCPGCRSTSIKRRKKTSDFRCEACFQFFASPESEVISVITYQSIHEAGWIDAEGVLDGGQLRALAERPNSQHSMRPLRRDEFLTELERELGTEATAALGAAGRRVCEQLQDGALHSAWRSSVVVRMRRGHAELRRRLLEEFGACCALSGPCPPEALEVGHLYSFARLGERKQHGGLLLRRDLHRLFEAGLLRINTDTYRIEVSPKLVPYPLYGQLHGQPPQVQLNQQHRQWLNVHWNQYNSLQ